MITLSSILSIVCGVISFFQGLFAMLLAGIGQGIAEMGNSFGYEEDAMAISESAGVLALLALLTMCSGIVAVVGGSTTLAHKKWSWKLLFSSAIMAAICLLIGAVAESLPVDLLIYSVVYGITAFLTRKKTLESATTLTPPVAENAQNLEGAPIPTTPLVPQKTEEIILEDHAELQQVQETSHTRANAKKPLEAGNKLRIIAMIVLAVILGSFLCLAYSYNFGTRAEQNAAKIIIDLRNTKAAAMMHYVDYEIWPDFKFANELDYYLSEELDEEELFGSGSQKATYKLASTVDRNNIILLGFDFGKSAIFSNSSPGVRKKLANIAQAVGLLGDESGYYDGGNRIFFPTGTFKSDQSSASDSSRNFPNDRDYAYECEGVIRVNIPGGVLNVRSHPSMDYDILDQLPHNTTVPIDAWAYDITNNASEDVWFRILDDYGRAYGWVNGKFCTVKELLGETVPLGY